MKMTTCNNCGAVTMPSGSIGMQIGIKNTGYELSKDGNVIILLPKKVILKKGFEIKLKYTKKGWAGKPTKIKK